MKSILISFLVVFFIAGNWLVRSDSGTDNWVDIISDKRIGLISTDLKIEEALKILGGRYLVVYDSIADIYETEYTYFFSMLNQDGKEVFRLNPDTEKGEKNEFIYSIEVFDNKYLIKETEVSVGADYEVLKNYFSVNEVYFDYEIGLFVFCTNFNGAFSLELDSIHQASLGQYDYATPNQIPDHFKIKSIIVY